MMTILSVLFIGTAVLALALLAVFFSVVRLWVRALTAGVPLDVARIVGMRLRGPPPQLLIDAYILLSKAGIQTSLDETEYVFMQNRNRIHHAEELVSLVQDRLKRK